VGVLSDPLRYRALFETFDAVRGARPLASSLLSFRNLYLPEGALETADLAAISVVASDDASVEAVRERLLSTWPARGEDLQALLGHGVGVFVRRDWMEALGGSTRAGVWVGSLVWIVVVGVAGVMITTLGLLTIRERYDEVAIRRCEGARRRDVVAQVVAEGALAALLGGAGGLLLGHLAAGVLADAVGVPIRFPLAVWGAATAIALGLGLASSALPARHAARLDPARVLHRRPR
jgi:hypothetical protein